MGEGLEGVQKGGPGGGPRLWTFSFCCFILLNFVVFMGFDVLLPTLSIYLEEQGHTQAEIGRIYSTFTVAAVTMRTLSPRLASRFPAMRLVALGFAVCAVAGALYYWFTGATATAMAVRFLHGLGFGVAGNLNLALASQIIPTSRMGEGMGYLGLGGTVALTIGPFLGIWLMDSLGFQTLFLAVAACYLCAVAIMLTMPRVSLPPRPAGAPKVPLVILSRAVWAPSALMFLYGCASTTVMTYMALFCKESGLPYAGHFFVISTAGIFLSRLTSGRVYDRFGHRYVVIPAAILLAVTLHVISGVHTPGVLFVAAVMYGLSSGTVFPSMQTLAVTSLPPANRTEATASVLNAFDFGVGTGCLVMGIIAGAFGNYRAVYHAGTALAIAFLLLYLAAYRLGDK